MKNNYKVWRLIIIFFVGIMLASCKDEKKQVQILSKSKLEHKNQINEATTQNRTQIDDPVLEFINTLDIIIGTRPKSAENLKKLVSDNGFYNIKIYVDGRDKNVIYNAYKQDIQQSSIAITIISQTLNKVGLSILYRSNFKSDSKVVELENSYLESIDWENKDESKMETNVSDLITGFNQIEKNYDDSTVYHLKNDVYIYIVQGRGNKTGNDFTGDGFVFKKEENDYKIIAIFNCQ